MMKYFFLFWIFFESVLGQTPYDSLYLKNKVYQQQIAFYESYKTISADVVMLGNSITFGVNWNELLGRTAIINRGIGSDNTVGMLHRLKYVYNLHPKLCFIMTGVNDIYADAPVDVIYKNYVAIIDTIRSKKIVPIIQSTLFVNPKWKRAEEKNPLIAQLNLLLKEYTRKNDILFIDLNVLLSENGILKEEYTTDGVHLTATAYSKWRELLEPILRKYKL